MAGPLAVVALVVSALMLGTMILALVLLRKGEGPRYSASRSYESNRRDAFRALTGETVDALPGGQWYDPRFEDAAAAAAIEPGHREAVEAALRALAPGEPAPDPDGGLRVGGIRVLPAATTAGLRARLEGAEPSEGIVAGLVLFNPEPPGGSADRVSLPVQSLFPALRRAGREDLVARFEALRAAVLDPTRNPEGGPA